MNIVWDFRLFSYGYADRGVGVWVSAMAEAIGAELKDERIVIWGEKNRVPHRFRDMASRWIDYAPGSWKSDLVIIPLLAAKYRIALFHYWVALGPIFRIGLGLCHPLCRTLLTIHDCGVEFWDTPPICASTRKTLYWKFQKRLFPRADMIVCNSKATQTDLGEISPASLAKSVILFPPLHYYGSSTTIRREKRFITLSGDSHKNTNNVIEAFRAFHKNHPEYSLIVLGEHEGVPHDCPGVSFDGMKRYGEYLENCSGFIVCSLYEGLGLPALEAMMRDCPLVVSDIPVFHETCDEAAIFVDPLNRASITRGLEKCALQGEDWSSKSAQGAAQYGLRSAGVGRKWLRMYHDGANIA